ncbi:hypothetical protein [Nocardia transvalensis]|uniref:hypothetical protein n=1 Tax=Nocardia transvalensis TaxID=37333 RepID=UPI0018940131|nr:hypothetical protein [Nocardia transvalensis]MBF6327274.1 hypothetical protein [Nocardia transvalensis]
MFSRLITASTITACALTALLLVITAACGRSDDKPDSPPPTGTLTVTEAVTQTYERFFDGSTSADDKIALVENGQAFADTIKAQADSPIAKSTTAEVTNVASTGTDHADVTFTILFNGKPALENQQGSAIRPGSTWKVSAATFCALLTLQGNPPPVCGTATPIPTS